MSWAPSPAGGFPRDRQRPISGRRGLGGHRLGRAAQASPAPLGGQVRFIDVLIRQAHPGPPVPPYRSPEQKAADADAYRREEAIPWTVVVDDLAGTVHRCLRRSRRPGLPDRHRRPGVVLPADNGSPRPGTSSDRAHGTRRAGGGGGRRGSGATPPRPADHGPAGAERRSAKRKRLVTLVAARLRLAAFFEGHAVGVERLSVDVRLLGAELVDLRPQPSDLSLG